MVSLFPLLLLLAVHVLVVADLAYWKARRWPLRWDGAFVVGLVVAAVAAVLYVLAVDYVLSFPVPDRLERPPFGTFVVDYEMTRKNASLWMLAPVVTWSLASAVGYGLGRRRQQHHSQAA